MLDEKINKALNSPFVGEVIFEDEEKKELVSRYTYYFEELRTFPSSIRVSEEVFVLFVALTQGLDLEVDDGGWFSHIFSEFKKYSSSSKLYIDIFRSCFYYRVMPTVFSNLKNTNVIIFEKLRDRYYATFLCHALSPKKTLETFFDYCFSIIGRYDVADIINDETFDEAIRKTFYNRFGENESIGSNSLTTEVRFSISITELSLEYPYKFIDFYKRVTNYIIQLLGSNNSDIGSDDNYLVKSILDWFPKRKDSFASHYRTWNRTNTLTAKFIPDVFYRINGLGEVFIHVSDFFLSDPTGIVGDNISYQLLVDRECVKQGKVYVSFDEPFYRCDEFDISLSSIFSKEDSENERILSNLVLVIYDKDTAIFDSEKNNESLRRTFILFPQLLKGDTKKEIFGSYTPGEYILYCPNFIDIVSGYQCQIEPLFDMDYVYIYNVFAQDGNYISFKNRNIFFFEKITYVKPEFFPLHCLATYKENDNLYEITTDGILTLRLGLNDRLEEYGYVVDTNLGNNDTNTINRDEFKLLSSCESYKTDDSQIIFIKCDIKNKPCNIRMARFKQADICLADKSFIYIENLEISYPNTLYFNDSLDFGITLNGEKINIKSGIIHLPELKGDLILSEPPLFECRIGNSGWLTMPKIHKSWYYNDISNSASISFKPESVHFDVLIDDTLLSDNKRFGETIYQLSNDEKKQFANVKIKYVLEGAEHEIDLMKVYFKPVFTYLPFSQIKNEAGKYELWWKPNQENFIGPIKNTTFKLVVVGQDQLKQNALSFQQQKIAIETPNFKLGIYRVKVYVNNPFKGLSDDSDCIIDESIYFGDSCESLESVRANENSNFYKGEDNEVHTEDLVDVIKFSHCVVERKGKELSMSLRGVYFLSESKRRTEFKLEEVYLADLWRRDINGNETRIASDVLWKKSKDYFGRVINKTIVVMCGCYDSFQDKVKSSGTPLYYRVDSNSVHTYSNKLGDDEQYAIKCFELDGYYGRDDEYEYV